MRNRAKYSLPCDPKPTLAVTQAEEHFPHAQQILCFGPAWVMDKRVQTGAAPALGHVWGLLGKEDNSSGRRQYLYFSTPSRQHNFKSVPPDPLSFGQGRRPHINQHFGISAVTWIYPYGQTVGSFYAFHRNRQNLRTAFVWASTYSIFTHLFPSQKHYLELVSKSGCQAVSQRPTCVTQDSQGEKGPVSGKCILNCIMLNVEPWRWISSLTQSWNNGCIWESSQHFPCLFYIHNQHPNGCQGLVYFFFLKCELFSIALWPAARYTRCTMALWDSDSCWRNAVL